MCGFTCQVLCGVVAHSVVVCGCAPPEPIVEQRPTNTVSFTNVAVTVSQDVVNGSGEKGRVEADFNLDGLTDLALIRVKEGAPDEVEIFIRKPASASGGGTVPMAGNAYFRAGIIRRESGTRIVGIASRVHGRYTDLIVLVARAGSRNEMLHYVNDGSGFTER